MGGNKKPPQYHYGTGDGSASFFILKSNIDILTTKIAPFPITMC